jgi:hypothetical protein
MIVNRAERVDRRAARWLSALALVAAIVAAGSSSWAAPRPRAGRFSPTITPWHAIGGVSIGTTRAAVVKRYGPGVAHRRAPYRSGVFRYQEPGGWFDIGYDNTWHVQFLDTTSAYFRTPDGIGGVGSHIPLGSCIRVNGRCQYHWRFFNWGGVGPSTGGWLGSTQYGSVRLLVGMTVVNGQVSGFGILDNPPRPTP